MILFDALVNALAGSGRKLGELALYSMPLFKQVGNKYFATSIVDTQYEIAPYFSNLAFSNSALDGQCPGTAIETYKAIAPVYSNKTLPLRRPLYAEDYYDYSTQVFNAFTLIELELPTLICMATVVDYSMRKLNNYWNSIPEKDDDGSIRANTYDNLFAIAVACGPLGESIMSYLLEEDMVPPTGQADSYQIHDEQ